MELECGHGLRIESFHHKKRVDEKRMGQEQPDSEPCQEGQYAVTAIGPGPNEVRPLFQEQLFIFSELHGTPFLRVIVRHTVIFSNLIWPSYPKGSSGDCMENLEFVKVNQPPEGSVQEFLDSKSEMYVIIIALVTKNLENR